MTIKALLTSALLLGSSSLALARPATLADAQVRDHRTPITATATVLAAPPVQVAQAPRPAYDRDHRDHHDHRDRRDDRLRQPAQVVLSSSARIERSGRTMIAVGPSQPLRALTLQATGGKTTISKVVIRFANGRSQIVTPNATLRGTATYAIDLAGNQRNVTGLVVYGKSGRNASFQVLGA